MWDHRARISEVHDGDSVTIYQDDGRSEYAVLKIRLFGTYAPELDQPGGQETATFARQWVADRGTGDWPFIVTMIRNKSNTLEQMTFGRYVAMVTSASTGESLNVAVSTFVRANGYGGGIGSTNL